MYKILGADGQEYGPVNIDTLQRWITEGRANAQTLVQAEGSSDWKPLSAFPELQGLLAAVPSPAGPPVQPAPAPARPATEGPQKGLAVASLVLGILSLLICVTGIPAIITGAIAQSRVRRDPTRYGGRGLALAGLILGCAGTLWGLLILPALMLPALAKAKERAQQVACVNNLKQIGLAARLYATDNNGLFPRDLLSLSNELGSPLVLTCPADHSRGRASTWAEASVANVSYEFLTPGAKEADVLNQPAFRCPIHNNVGYGDGSVQMGGPRQRWTRPPEQ